MHGDFWQLPDLPQYSSVPVLEWGTCRVSSGVSVQHFHDIRRQLLGFLLLFCLFFWWAVPQGFKHAHKRSQHCTSCPVLTVRDWCWFCPLLLTDPRSFASTPSSCTSLPGRVSCRRCFSCSVSCYYLRPQKEHREALLVTPFLMSPISLSNAYKCLIPLMRERKCSLVFNLLNGLEIFSMHF